MYLTWLPWFSMPEHGYAYLMDKRNFIVLFSWSIFLIFHSTGLYLVSLWFPAHYCNVFFPLRSLLTSNIRGNFLYHNLVIMTYFMLISLDIISFASRSIDKVITKSYFQCIRTFPSNKVWTQLFIHTFLINKACMHIKWHKKYKMCTKCTLLSGYHGAHTRVWPWSSRPTNPTTFNWYKCGLIFGERENY